ncbi:5-formyltetrahydrofolate cyclo-ligase [Rudaeicoccus suwonensis]|uniref:5-formyltetrahydrofolate cyclo-ligase n=1 Tax=Rudaeicoccus suwonensis TaxID=657409 RepID=A0A561E824_9MICO|nr:5-formyltetrahydrofolate cyclo-ligase [Rudaeicoccus suwonensis]TWE11746.1 5-formyltetrahydrofolate cyclo-ligase [Rudaeicoccus suwonensis]
MATETAQAKQAMRRVIRARRRERRQQADDNVWRELSTTLADAVLTFVREAAPDAACVAVYESLDTEPPTEQLITGLRARQRQVIAPITLPDKDLSWRDVAGNADLGVDHIAAADVIVLPALAIDAHGMRLGQGGGSYDRALARRGPHALTLAVVFDGELVAGVPAEPHDLPVDAVWTPTGGILRFA